MLRGCFLQPEKGCCHRAACWLGYESLRTPALACTPACLRPNTSHRGGARCEPSSAEGTWEAAWNPPVAVSSR